MCLYVVISITANAVIHKDITSFYIKIEISYFSLKRAHNPKVVSSSLTPATIVRTTFVVLIFLLNFYEHKYLYIVDNILCFIL